jgi:hypothetical protein
VTPIATYVQGDSGDYTINSTNASWSITPLTVRLTPGSYNGVYDGKTHALSGCVSTSPDLLDCTNSPVGPVGPNAITSAQTVSPTAVYTKGDARDYNIIPNNGSWNISQALLTIAASSATVYYGDPVPIITPSFIGFVNGETQTVLSMPTCKTDYTTTTPVGTAATTTCFGASAVNYTFNYVGGSVTIKAWTVTGFYSPVAPTIGGTPVLNAVKGGSTVPLKFNIFAGSVQKTSTAAVKSVYLSTANCTSGVFNDATELLTDTGATALRFDTTALQFIQNWKTPKGTGCYFVQMTAMDGSALQAYFMAN